MIEQESIAARAVAWAIKPSKSSRKSFLGDNELENYMEKYWKIRLEKCRRALEKNNFEVFLADNVMDAKGIVLEEILPKISVKSVSMGGSLTLHATGILEEMRQHPDIRMIETFAENVSREEILERRRQALLVDLFFTGSNAVTETGTLVNLDMIGNRVGAITFGPKNVIILIGRNKIVATVEDAMDRIRNYAAPLNAIQHSNFKTPCRETSYCMDCQSPDRICNTWTITEKSFPQGRIKVVLINEHIGM
jgi:L-lactate utilization protein LutB